MSSPDTIPPVEPPSSEITQFRKPPVENPIWSLFDVSAILGFAIVSLIIVGGLGIGIAKSLPSFRGVKPADLAQNATIIVPVQTISYLLVIAFMVLIVRLRHGTSFLASISWNWPVPKTILSAILGGAGLAVFSNIFAGLTSRWIPKSLPIDNYFHDTRSTYLLALFGITFAPLMEELFFRGFLYPALARRIGMGAAVLLTAASFAVLHQGQLAHAWVPLTWLFLVGTVLTVIRARTKSAALCVIVHMAYNATVFAFVFISTQGFHHLEHV